MEIVWDTSTIACLVIFILTYLGIALGRIWGLRLDRAGISLLGGIMMLAFGCITLKGSVDSAINFPSILMLFGLMTVSSQLHYGGFYHVVAEKISKFIERPALFLIILMLASGILSAFLNNDVVCFAFAPVVTVALLKKRYNPVPFLIALAVSSNIGCAMTLIGNAQDILVGEIAHIGFGEYMAWAIIPVTLSMAAAYGIIYLIGRKSFRLPDDQEVPDIDADDTEFHTWRTLKGLITIVTIVILFFTPLPRYLVTLVAAGLLLCSHKLESKKVLALVDWQLLILFIGLFVVVGAFHDSGIPQFCIKWLNGHGVDLHNHYVLTLVTGALSNLINNSATVMLMVKIVDLSSHVNGYILALANTLAGNLFLIGSVANIIVVQKAAEYKVKISFGSFAKYGVPVAVSSYAFLLIWIWIMTKG